MIKWYSLKEFRYILAKNVRFDKSAEEKIEELLELVLEYMDGFKSSKSTSKDVRFFNLYTNKEKSIKFEIDPKINRRINEDGTKYKKTAHYNRETNTLTIFPRSEEHTSELQSR